jgi:hypothetical protein
VPSQYRTQPADVGLTSETRRMPAIKAIEGRNFIVQINEAIMCLTRWNEVVWRFLLEVVGYVSRERVLDSCLVANFVRRHVK